MAMRRFRPRARRVIAPVLVLAIVAGVTALLETTEPPTWLGWLPRWLAEVVLAALGVAGAWWFDKWAKRRQLADDREQQAVERLRQHLGRRASLPRIGEPSGGPLALRVHQAEPLADGGEPRRETRPSRFAGFRRGTVGRGGAAALDPALPLFVDRGLTAGVRDWLRGAREEGGFLLLVGWQDAAAV